MHIANDELKLLSFNSNISCPCSENFNTPSDLNLLLKSYSNKDYAFYINDIYENFIDPSSNFKYYDIHDFHTLKTTLDPKKTHKYLSHKYLFPPSQHW